MAGRVALFGVSMPLAVSAVIFWFWRISLTFRIWLAVLVGIFFDTLSPYPWGLFISGFCVAAFATEFLQRIFAPISWYSSGFTGVDSAFPRIIGMGIGIFIVLFLVFFIGFWGEYGLRGMLQNQAAFWGNAFVGIIFWTVIIPFGIFAGAALVKKFR